MTIKTGDLVMVVGSHCAGFAGEALGVVYRVGAIVGPRAFKCQLCQAEFTGLCADDSDGDWRIPLPYLKRIPPMGELEGERRDEKLKEPA